MAEAGAAAPSAGPRRRQRASGCSTACWRTATGGSRTADPTSRTRIAELQRRADEAGRGRIPVTFFGAAEDPAQLERLRAAGVDRVLFYLPPRPADEVEAAADRIAKLIV